MVVGGSKWRGWSNGGGGEGRERKEKAWGSNDDGGGEIIEGNMVLFRVRHVTVVSQRREGERKFQRVSRKNNLCYNNKKSVVISSENWFHGIS